MATKQAAAKPASDTKKAPVKKEAAKKAPVVIHDNRGKDYTFAVHPKLGDPSGIVKQYDGLIEALAKMEAAQKLAKLPWRIYFIHRKKVEVMKMNLLRNLR